MDVPRPGTTRFAPGLLAAAGGVVVLAGLAAAADLVSLVVLAVLATILLVPVQAALRRRGWPGWLALTASLVIYVGVLGAAALLVVVGLLGFLRDLPAHEDELTALVDDIAAALGGARGSSPIDASTIGAAIREAAAGILGAVATVGYSVFIVAYLLLEAPRTEDRLRWAFGARTDAIQRGAALADRLRSYIVARAILGAVAALLDTALLLVLGVPAALLWGVLSFLLSFIPNVGFILALVPPTVLGLLVGGPTLALAVVIGYTIINLAIDYVVQPRFIGGSVDLSPVVITVCLLFWAVILGGAGALLAVPMTIIAAALFDAFEDTRPFGRLLADHVGLEDMVAGDPGPVGVGPGVV